MSEPPNQFGDGAAYERMMGRWSHLVGEKFLDWLGPPNGLRWIDVGCGNGAFTEVLIGRCAPAAVTGIDPSDAQIAYAHERQSVKMARFRVADAQDLPFEDNSFEAAAMALVISFVTDPQKAADEMARVTKPGGPVATYMWDIPGGGLPVNPVYMGLMAIGAGDRRPVLAPQSNRDAMEHYWKQAGMKNVSTDVVRIQVAYDDFDDFWKSCNVPVGPSGNAVANLTPAKRQELREHLREKLKPAPNGRIVYEAFCNAVKGTAPE
jgi:ubiquinone/menaquinone biosynthesis C-methylase UbiE